MLTLQLKTTRIILINNINNIIFQQLARQHRERQEEKRIMTLPKNGDYCGEICVFAKKAVILQRE